MNIEIALLISVISVCFSVYFGLKNNKRTDTKDIEERVKANTRINVKLIKDKYIPCILGVLGILLCAIWVMANTSIGTVPEMLMAVFTSIVQGVLVAGLSVYGNQLIKQIKSSE